MRENSKTSSTALKIWLVVSTVLLSSCSAIDDTHDMPSEVQVTHEVQATDVQVTISATSGQTPPSDRATPEVSLENHSPLPVAFGASSGSCAHAASVRVGSEEYWVVDTRICTQDAPTLRLDPGESRVESWEWGGSIWRNERIELLPPGRYMVRGAAGMWTSANEVEIEIVRPLRSNRPLRSIG
jgi:hypothetical protein